MLKVNNKIIVHIFGTDGKEIKTLDSNTAYTVCEKMESLESITIQNGNRQLLTEMCLFRLNHSHIQLYLKM